MIRSVGAVLASVFFVAVLSLVWDRLTPTPPPGILTAVRLSLLKTPLGQELSDVLGVSSEEKVQPLDPRQILTNVRDRTIGGIEERIGYVLTTQAVRGIIERFDELTEEQKDVLRQYICSTESGQLPADGE